MTTFTAGDRVRAHFPDAAYRGTVVNVYPGGHVTAVLDGLPGEHILDPADVELLDSPATETGA